MLEERLYQAREYTPKAIIRCKHGTNPACICVTCYNVDKNCPLTKQEIIVQAAALELNRMEKWSIYDERKFLLLGQIKRCEEDMESIYNEYQSLYGSLIPKPPIQLQKRNKLNNSAIILIMFIILLIPPLLVMVDLNT